MGFIKKERLCWRFVLYYERCINYTIISFCVVVRRIKTQILGKLNASSHFFPGVINVMSLAQGFKTLVSINTDGFLTLDQTLNLRLGTNIEEEEKKKEKKQQN